MSASIRRRDGAYLGLWGVAVNMSNVATGWKRSVLSCRGRSPWASSAQLGRTLQPHRRVAAMIRVFGRLDTVEEPLIDHRLPRRGDRPEEIGGARWIGTGDGLAP